MSSQWLDNSGNQWRFSTGTNSWQKLLGSRWVTTGLPSGGLHQVEVAAGSDTAVIIERDGLVGPEGPPGPPGKSSLTVAEVLSPEFQDGVNDVFPLSTAADLSQAFQVFRNGLMEIQGHGYLVTPTYVTFTTPPLDSDVLTVVYQKAQ